MRTIPQAPSQFNGSLSELYAQHANHVLIETEQVREFHRALMDYLKADDPVFLVRHVTGLERGETIRTKRGHLIKGSDNAPPWYIHKALYTQTLSAKQSFRDFLDSAWCHYHDTHNHRPHINSQKWYVAHIFRAKDGNTAFHDWDRKELTKRMVRSIHPCNYFYVPITDGRKYGEDPMVISYFYEKFFRIYGDVWDSFLAAADAEPIPYSPTAAQYKYRFGSMESELCPVESTTSFDMEDLVIRLPDDAVTERTWNFNDSSNKNHNGHIPQAQKIITMTLNWKADSQGRKHHVGNYCLNLSSLFDAGYVRKETGGIRLRFQRTGQHIEIAINRKNPALVIGEVQVDID